MGRSGRTKAVLAAAAVCLPVGLMGCGSSSTPDAAPTTTASTTTTAAIANSGADVTIKEFEFVPGDVTIKVNQAVSWTNQGSAKHTVTAAKDQAITFKSQTLANGDKPFVQTFSTPGTYQYFCSVHPDKMKGTITVTS